MLSDPIADMLTRIKNGYQAGKKTVGVPHSGIKEKMAKLLVREGYLKAIKIVKETPKIKNIELSLKYQAGEPVLRNVKRISKPGVRVYVKSGKIPLVRMGSGITLVSTSQGVMTDKEVRKKNLGGEVIGQVW